MKKKLIILIIIIQTFSSHGQTPVGSWSDHLNYTTARNVAVGEAEVFASTGSSLIVYNKEFAELKKMTRINGLTETGISTIAWSEEHNALIIAYSTTNVDILRNNKIYNIPDISRKYIPGKKEINRIRINGKYAYLACSFGIVVLDIDKREIYDTWKPGSGSENTEVLDLTFGGGKVFAATGAGVYSADLSDQGLAYFGNWNIISILPDPLGIYTSLAFSGNVLYVNQSVKLASGDYVYAINNGYSLFSFTPGVFNSSFEPAPGGFTISSAASVKYYNSDGSLLRTISHNLSGTPKISHAIADDKDIWIADLNSGLIRGENMLDFTPLTLPGPVSNNAYSITSLNGKTIICGGGADVSWNNLWRPLQVSVHENNNWISLAPATIKDPMRALIDPSDNDHYFISTWGGGLLEYQDNTLINQFNDSNSPLQTVIPNKPYVRIGGLAMDKERRLWFTHNEVPGSIKALKTDGSWIINPAITINVYTIGDIIIARNGYKWVVLPRGNGLFVLDDNNTPENFNDDRYKTMLIQDADNRIISFVYTLTEDLDGHIWVGTDQGPLIYYNPERVFDEEIKAYRIKISRSDDSGTADYLLGTESITSIAVDGANKKWLGTFSSGVYHLSSDGATLIKNFNEKNSPVLSNSIVSMAVDNKTGDVWFGTSKGVQSYRGDAVAGEEKLADIYTFPNPVREDYSGNVTIAGLMRDTQIRITDISGNLVYRTISDGGFATWDLSTYNGKRVATGVYLVFCASSDGSQSAVTKMLVIK
jgi:hypothetical protein